MAFVFLFPISSLSQSLPTSEINAKGYSVALTFTKITEGRGSVSNTTTGIPIGYSKRRLLILTTKHGKKKYDYIFVKYKGEVLYQASSRNVSSYHIEGVDAEILKVPYGQKFDLFVSNLIRIPSDGRAISRGSSVYAYGCDEASCLGSPIRGVVESVDSVLVAVRSPFMEPGMSGSPLVGPNGHIIGMVTESGTSTRAIRWDYISSSTDTINFDISRLKGDFNPGEHDPHLSSSVQIFPLPPGNGSGRPVFPTLNISARLYSILDCCSISAGIGNESLRLGNLDALVGSSFGGVRYFTLSSEIRYYFSPQLFDNKWLLFGPFATVSFPFFQTMRVDLPDPSTSDPVTGEPKVRSFASLKPEVPPLISVGFAAEYSLYPPLWINISTTLFKIPDTVDLSDSFNLPRDAVKRASIIEFGISLGIHVQI